jgi:GNAT superfamily N-acetyltransferase
MTTRQLTLSDADAAASVHRASFEDRLPWLAGLHTPDEDRDYFTTVVFDKCEVWGSFYGNALVGFIAFRESWIDQLYVLPAYQGRGIGGALLGVAQARFSELQLWSFQKNEEARNFYENRGFKVAEQTDGSGNEEHEPDVRYVWQEE